MFSVLTLFYAFPVTCSVVAGLILAAIIVEKIVRRGVPFALRLAIQSHGKFQYLPAVEQALRRGSRGFALVVLSAGAAVLLHVEFFGWRDFAGVASRPLEMWSLLACLAAFVSGAVWLYTGASKTAGARDPDRWFYGALRFAGGAVATFYLWRADLFGRFALSPAGVLACAAVFAVPLWFVLVGFMRVLLLSWPRGRAHGKAEDWIEDDEFTWSDDQRRRR